MSTFQYQDKIQKLPIPPLKDTCERYLSVLKPLQTEEEHKRTIAATQQFLNGIGPHLDEQLREYAKTRPSYIEQFWFDSYLNYDSPVVLNLNPFFLLEDDPTPVNNTQVKRAASLTQSSLEFVRALRREELPPDMIRDTPLCMDQYNKLFGSARIPTSTGCVMQSDQSSHHIVVLSRSQFYWFDVLDKENNLILTDEELGFNFDSILKDSSKSTPSEIARSSFGVLTTENRKAWANIRSNLLNDPTNYKIIRIIDSALFVVVLDDIELESLSDLSKNMLCGLSILDKGAQVGTCTNRWYDKLQLIITKNAKAGINFEHTGVDGHTVLRFCSDIYTDSILKFAKSINPNSPSIWKSKSPSLLKKDHIDTNVVTIPRKLEWNLTSDLSLALRFGETRLSDLISQNEFAVLEFDSYGSDTIKKLKCSPDAFVQMSFQAAYYALYGKVECTYEPAMTKQFLHGRTEAIRTVSMESNLFVRRFFENVPGKEKLDLLKASCAKHTDTTKKCSQGLGQDRHLYALFSIWKRYVADAGYDSDGDVGVEEVHQDNLSDSSTIGNDVNHGEKDVQFSKDIPPIFEDSGWDKLNNSIISTSNCGNPSLRVFGFGPVTSNGFGIAYIIKSNSITVCVSSKHRQTQRFVDTLKHYLEEVKDIYDQEIVSAEKVKERGRLQQTRSGNLNYLLGGYGYFDLEDDEIKSRGNSPDRMGFRRGGISARQLSEKLRLAEY
ncbi:CYFA0S01e13894g1_1 [Cyberlindnera fabianii]|uniref:CYFA0S01e13894g1_1 n=1 Tax=Cyberlindnera fabianii TaxID=36022 RepID=A0A061ASD0_CYBFA|nr:putative mitochondrial carnitine O-acetyltransferase [Cyberlindnera fabianii]CDR37639.1 CYFA0S01e13894g1_1 [Cyberlindnera fabianii]